jgi:hypothetical protein
MKQFVPTAYFCLQCLCSNVMVYACDAYEYIYYNLGVTSRYFLIFTFHSVLFDVSKWHNIVRFGYG